MKQPSLCPTPRTDPNLKGYVENLYTKKDYQKLYELANSSFLKTRIRTCRFRDKRFQRTLLFPDIKNIFYCDYNQIPLHINSKDKSPDIIEIIKDIARWRLSIHK